MYLTDLRFQQDIDLGEHRANWNAGLEAHLKGLILEVLTVKALQVLMLLSWKEGLKKKG